MPKYRVKPGYHFGKDNSYGPGDVVELTEHEATPLLWKLELVDEAKPVVEVHPSATKVISVSDKSVADIKTWLETNPDSGDVEKALALEENDKNRTGAIEAMTAYILKE